MFYRVSKQFLYWFFLQAEAKKRKILSVKNAEELTDEKVELYTNRMKETILRERTKATRQAAGNLKSKKSSHKEK